MGFIRENILKIVTIIVILIVAILVMIFAFGGKNTTKANGRKFKNCRKKLFE